MKKKVVAAVFILFLFGMGAAGWMLPDREFSEQENRYLEQLPEINGTSVANGSYMTKLEKYFSDQSPLRDFLVRTHNSLLRLMGRQMINQIYFAEDHRLIQIYDVDLKQAERNIEAINGWAGRMSVKVPVSFVLVPTASAIYEEELPDFDLGYDYRDLESLLRDRLTDQVQTVSLGESLKQYKNESIYYRSDHHWTMRGAFYGWKAIQAALGKEPIKQEYGREILSEDFRGSLYSQAPILGYTGEAIEVFQTDDTAKMTVTSEDIDEHTLIWKEKLTQKDQYAAFLGGNYGEMIITNPQAPDRTLLLFKDSYANAILPFMAEEYNEIYVLDLRYFRKPLGEYLQEKKVEEVIFLYNADFFCTDNNFGWLTVE